MSFQSISKNVIYLSLIIGISVVLGFDDGLLSTIIVFILICIVIAGLVMYFNWKNKILAPFLPYLMALFIGIAAVSYYKDSTNKLNSESLERSC